MKFFFLNFNTKSLIGFLSLFLLLVLIPSSYAIGVSPPFAYADYTDNYNATFGFTLKNNNPDPNIEVELSMKGDLAKYATLSEESFTFDSLMHGFQVHLNFPSYEEIGIYGNHKLRIRASEIGKRNGMFTVGTAVEVWIEVFIPVPGSFAEVSSVSVNNAFEGEDTDLSFSLVNRGSSDISGSSAKVYIKDFSGNVIDTFTYNNIDIPYTESVTFSDNIQSSSYVSGMYTAVVEYKFNPDFVPSQKSTIFFIGSTDVILTNYTKELVEGQINKVVFTSQSLWGSQLKNVEFDLFYGGASHPLPYMVFAPFQQIRFESFIETPLITDKKADSIPFSAIMKLKIPNGDGTFIDKEIPLSFVIVKKPSSFNISSTTLLIIGGVILLVALILINFLVLFKPKKKSSSKKK